MAYGIEYSEIDENTVAVDSDGVIISVAGDTVA